MVREMGLLEMRGTASTRSSTRVRSFSWPDYVTSSGQDPSANPMGRLPHLLVLYTSRSQLGWSFNIYLLDYCKKCGYHKTATQLITEAHIPQGTRAPIAAAPQGLLFERWSVFWVLFTTRYRGVGADEAFLYNKYQDQRTSHAQQVPPPVGPPSPARHSSLSVPGTVPSLPAGQMGGIGPGGQSASYGPANPPPANGTPSPPGPPDVPGQPPSPGMVSSPPVGHQQQHPNAADRKSVV